MSATLTGDHRTRLTHTLEVEQIALSVADSLRLNKDLVSAIALGHDVGHTPFGHAAEKTLNKLLKDNGGFHHPKFLYWLLHCSAVKSADMADMDMKEQRRLEKRICIVRISW
jgi:HD superfamily phosphohydrolase